MKNAELIPHDPNTGEVLPPATVVDATSLLAVITRAASDDSISVEKVERMMALYERITARQNEQAFNAAMKAAQQEMPQVTRDADNSHTKSRYARLETISAAMNPVLAKHGFSISFGTADSPLANHYRITAEVSHDGGHSRRYQADIPADSGGAQGKQNKSATHAFGSTMSYGRRYLKMLIFDVVTKGEDDDGNGASRGSSPPIREEITDGQLVELRELLRRIDVNEPSFCKAMRIPSLPAAPAQRFEELKHELMEFGREKGVL